jgi:predicted Zn finger-like uncharacterized protein
MNISCPNCDTIYRIDPERVPAQGVTTFCRSCEAALRISPEASNAPGVIITAEAAASATAAPATTEPEPPAPSVPESPDDPVASPEGPAAPEPTGFEAPETLAPAPMPPAFGPQDPETRARRLARALVSDIKVYNAEKWEECRTRGTLREEFRDEILKSWDEYVEQVGERMAKQTPFFRDALNDILAAGERVF